MDKQLPVSVWPEWKIIEKIGEGSFGKVYKASREEQGKVFYSAIKVITIPSTPGELSSVRSENPSEQSVREYFHGLVDECIQEVSTMEYFRGNSHVVSVEDYKVVEYLDDIGWDIYIRMEYLTSFLDYCAGRELTEEDVLHLGIDLCRALEYCQKQNIIHRDIKPENIFISRFGEFKLGDFGIARELERTMSGLSKKGTFSYMAPEMYKGEEYDSRVDIYSLGIVLYKLRNHNRLPFIDLKKQLITYRDKEKALNRRMAGEKLPRPVDAGDAFAEVIQKACAYNREDRFGTAEEFREALESVKNQSVRTKTSAEKKTALNSVKNSPVKVKSGENIAKSVPVSVIPEKPEPTYVEEKQRKRLPPNANKKTARQKRKSLSSAADSQYNKKKSVRSASERRGTNALIAAVVIMFIAVCIVIGVFIWLLRENAELQRLKKSVTETVQSAENKQLQTTLEEIRNHATEISENLNNYSWVGSEEEGRISYLRANSDGTWDLMKVLVYPSKSVDGYYEEYYYWDGELFFAYIWADHNTLTYLNEEEVKTDLYYYDGGKLVRWIDENGVCHDNETDNDEYVNRGNKYWDQGQAYQYELNADSLAGESAETEAAYDAESDSGELYGAGESAPESDGTVLSDADSEETDAAAASSDASDMTDEEETAEEETAADEEADGTDVSEAAAEESTAAENTAEEGTADGVSN